MVFSHHRIVRIVSSMEVKGKPDMTLTLTLWYRLLMPFMSFYNKGSLYLYLSIRVYVKCWMQRDTMPGKERGKQMSHRFSCHLRIHVEISLLSSLSFIIFLASSFKFVAWWWRFRIQIVGCLFGLVICEIFSLRIEVKAFDLLTLGSVYKND